MREARDRQPPPGAGRILERSFAISSVPVPWRRVAGTAVTTTGALLLGLATGHLDWGAWTFLGGFTSFYIADQPYRARAGLLAAVALGMAIALGVGSLSLTGWEMALAFGAFALAATYGAGAARLPLPAGFMFILVACVGAATPAPGELPERLAFALAGGAMAWIVGMADALARPWAPVERRIARAYAAVAAFGEALGTPHATAREREAWASVARVRRRHAPPRLAYLAERADAIFWATVAVSAERTDPLPSRWTAAIRRLGHQTPSVVPLRARAGAESAERRLADSIAETAARLAGPAVAPARAAASIRVRVPAGVPPFLPHASLRTGLTVAAALLLAQTFGVAHPYWLPLTVAAVLQGHTVEMLSRRAVQRVVGTVGGLALAALLVVGLRPAPALALAMVIPLQAAMRVLMVKNYGLAVMPMTAFALLLIYASSPSGAPALLAARLGDTLLGVVLALAATYLLWARTSSGRLPRALATLIRHEADLLSVLCGGRATSPAPEARRLGAALARVGAIAADAANEVPASATAARLESALQAATRLGLLLEAAIPGAVEIRADEATAAQATAALRDMASRAEGAPAPANAPRPLPDLGPVGREMRTLSMALGS